MNYYYTYLIINSQAECKTVWILISPKVLSCFISSGSKLFAKVMVSPAPSITGVELNNKTLQVTCLFHTSKSEVFLNVLELNNSSKKTQIVEKFISTL